jgi:tetratricopeptide (TPR) repeat protein
MGPNQESLARRGAILLRLGRFQQAVADLERARSVQTEMGDRLVLVDTLTWLAIAYLRCGQADRSVATSEEALRLLVEIGNANMQPQRVWWHHFAILEELNRKPREAYLDGAIRLLEMQAITLSQRQRFRFYRQVSLNKVILEAYSRTRGTPRVAAGTRLVANASF